MKVPFSPPDITDAEVNLVAEALRSGWITTGPKTKELETKVASYCNTPKAACLNSATAALELALHALGVGPGDEVITCAYTYTASASVAVHVGATLKLVDCQKDSYEMDYDQLKDAITEKTKVVIPVDIAGKMVDYQALFAAVEAKKDLYRPTVGTLQEAFDRVIVLADGAHSFGATQNGLRSGAVADLTAFSFHAVKNLTTAEGGALTWKPRPGIDDEALYKNLMLLSLHGQSKDALAKSQLGAWEYDIVIPAYKCNMTDVHAAIGLAQFERYGSLLARRKDIVSQYDAAFSDKNAFDVIDHYGPAHDSSGHLYLLRLVGFDAEKRGEFIARMAQADIACNVHYKPLPLHTAYKNLGFDIARYPNAYERFANEVSLPLHTCLTDEQVAYVIENALRVHAELA